MSLEIYEGGGLVRRPTVLWRFDPEDARIDSIRETAGTEEHVVVSGEHQGQTGTLFGKGAHIATHGGKIYHGRADAMEVEELTAAGDLVRILRIRDFPLILTAEQIRVERRAMLDEESVSWWRDIVARVPAPPTRPAYDDIIADPTALSGPLPRSQRGAGDVAGDCDRRNVAGRRGDSRELPCHGHRDGRGARSPAGCTGRRAPAGAAAPPGVSSRYPCLARGAFPGGRSRSPTSPDAAPSAAGATSASPHPP